MGRKFTWLSKVTWLLVVVFSASAAAGAEEFYKGKTLRFVVGASPGGGLDAYARAIARHIGNKIPGNPTTIVENMPGAGSLVFVVLLNPDRLDEIFDSLDHVV